MFDAGSKFDKLAAYVLNGAGLLLMLAGSQEFISFVSPETVAYIALIGNIVKAAATKAREYVR